MLCWCVQEYIDLFQPHPDFTLVSPVNRIPADEMDYYLGTCPRHPTTHQSINRYHHIIS